MCVYIYIYIHTYVSYEACTATRVNQLDKARIPKAANKPGPWSLLEPLRIP